MKAKQEPREAKYANTWSEGDEIAIPAIFILIIIGLAVLAWNAMQ